MSSPQSTAIECTRCQAKLRANAKFCSTCGQELGASSETANGISGIHEMLESAESIDVNAMNASSSQSDSANDLSGMSGMFDALETVNETPTTPPRTNGHSADKAEQFKPPKRSQEDSNAEPNGSDQSSASGTSSVSGVRMSSAKSGVRSGVRAKNAPTFVDGVIRFSCRGCGRSIRAKEKKAGQQINCPSCKTPLKVPRTPDQIEKEKSFTLRSGDESGETVSFAELARKAAEESPTVFVADPENEPSETNGDPPKKSQKTGKDSGLSKKQRKTYTQLFARSLDDLVSDEQDSLIQEWKDALRVIGQSGDSAAIDLVKPFLDHHSRELQRVAIVTAGELRDPSIVPDLIRLIDDSGPATRKTISIALGNIGDGRAVRALLTLGIEDPHVKIPATDAIQQIGPAAAEPLLKALVDKESGLVLEAVVMLGRLKVTEAARPLIRVLEAGSWILRAHAAQALGKLGDARVLGSLQKALADSNPNVRANAAAALGQLGDDGCVTALRKCLQDSDPDVVTQTVSALGRIGDPRAASALVPLLESPDANLRLLVSEALGDMGDERAVPNLLAVLDTDDEKLQLKVLAILRKLRAPEAIPDLLQLLKHRSEMIRQRACDALGRMGDADVAERLETVLSVDPSTEVRAAAARALGEIADPGSVDSLKKALEDEFLVRCQAIIALGTVGDQENVSDLLNLLEDRTPEIKYHAAVALAELGATRAVSPIRKLLEDSNPMVVRGATKALEKLGEPVALADVKKAQRRAQYRGLYEVLLSVRSFLPEGRQAVIVGLGALAIVVLAGGFMLASMFLFQPPPKVVLVRGNASQVSFSLSGQQVCTGRTTGLIEVYNTTDGKRTHQFQVPNGGKTATFAHSDGELILLSSKALQLWNLAIEDPAQQPVPAASHARQITDFVTSGNRAFGMTRSNDGMVIVWDLSSGQNTGVAKFSTSYTIFAVSPDGSLIAGASGNGQILLIDAATGQTKGNPINTSGSGAIRGMIFNSEGTKLAVSGVKFGLAIYNTEGTKLAQVETPSGTASSLRFTPDGSQLVGSLGARFGVWKVSEGSIDAQPSVVNTELDLLTSWDLSPDGRQIAVCSEESMPVLLYDLNSGQEISKLNEE